MINLINKIINNQLELNDKIDSYGYHSYMGSEVFEDENGKYRIKTIEEERPCKCHPETCTHFEQRFWRIEEEKIYLKKE